MDEMQLWRVFSPATKEAMPWCATWEDLAVSALSCHLLDEIRAPAPGLDPFEGLDIPPIRDTPQPNCSLLALPPELLYAVTDHLHSLPDILSLSLTCNPLLSVCLQKLRVSLHDRMKGAWINTPLICLGSLTSVTADLPPRIQPIKEALEVLPRAPIPNAFNLTYNRGDRRPTYHRFEVTHTLLQRYDRFDLSEDLLHNFRGMIRFPLPRLKSQLSKSPMDALIVFTADLPSWTHRLIKRAKELDNGTLRVYSQTANYVIRNLTKKEYIPFTAGETLKSELEYVFFRSQTIPIDQAVTIIFLFLISWSPSMRGLEDEAVRKNGDGVHGIWAGDCFDVCEMEKLDDTWRSVEDETLLSLRLYMPRMYKNTHGQNRWGGAGGA